MVSYLGEACPDGAGSIYDRVFTPFAEHIFAADGSYKSKETISFLSDKLGASLLGTHKNNLWYPFVSGEGLISRRHRGMNVSERGCRAVHTARQKGGGLQFPG